MKSDVVVEISTKEAQAAIEQLRSRVWELEADRDALAARVKVLEGALIEALPFVRREVWCANCERAVGYECSAHGWNKHVGNDFYQRLRAALALDGGGK